MRSLPAPLSFEGGATLPYCGMLAWDMLVTAGCLLRLSTKCTEVWKLELIVNFKGGLGPDEKSRGKAVFVWGGVRALERLTVQVDFQNICLLAFWELLDLCLIFLIVSCVSIGAAR